MRRSFLALLFIALVGLAFYGRALLPGRVLLPTDIITQGWPPWQEPNVPVHLHNPLLTDVVNYIYPVKTFMAEAVRDGEYPLWNPYIFTGYPFTYNTQAGLLYPLSIFYYLFEGATAVDATIFAQLLLGAGFMFAYLRQLGVRRPSAVLGTVVFLFNGSMVVWLEWQVVHAAVIWLPAQLYVVERLARQPSQAHSSPFSLSPLHFLLPLLFAIPWLGGHWNWTLYTSLTVAMYMMWRLPGWGRVWQTAVSLGLGSALALVQVIPAFAYLSQTHRQPLPFWDLLAYGLHSRAVVWFVPNFFGNSVAQNWWGPAISNDVETAVYLGLLPLVLVTAALCLRRDWPTRFFALWGGLGLLWALGTPVYGMLAVLPVFNGLHPSRAAVVPIFAIAVLAALGLDALLSAERPWPRRLWWGWAGLGGLNAAVVGGWLWYFAADVATHWPFLRGELLVWALFAILCAALLGWWGSHKFSPVLLVAVLLLTTADLWLFGHDFNTIGYTADIYPPTATAAYLQADGQQEISRITSLAEGLAFYPNTALAERIPNFSGYEPGIPLRLVHYVEAAESGPAIYFERILMPNSAPNSPLLKLANVKHIVTIRELWAAEAVAGPRQDEATSQWRPLPVRQAIAMPGAGLQRLDVPVRGGGQEQLLMARILAADASYEFANATLPIPATDGWVSFYFSPFPSEWGREFVWELSVVGEGTAEIGAAADGQPAFVAYYLPRPALVQESRKTRIYLNEGYFPRAFAVPHAVVVADETAALATLLAQPEQHHQQVVLELEGQPAPAVLGRPAADWAAEVAITHYGLNEVRLTADLPEAGFVVLADTFYAGWEAAVDGQPTPIYRANSIMRGVAVPAGAHEVVFVFRPPDFYGGAAVSGMALLICVVGLWWGQREKWVLVLK